MTFIKKYMLLHELWILLKKKNIILNFNTIDLLKISIFFSVKFTIHAITHIF